MSPNQPTPAPHPLAPDPLSPSAAIYEWASALTAFVRSPRMRGHRIVPLGHSAGAGAMYVAPPLL